MFAYLLTQRVTSAEDYTTITDAMLATLGLMDSAWAIPACSPAVDDHIDFNGIPQETFGPLWQFTRNLKGDRKDWIAYEAPDPNHQSSLILREDVSLGAEGVILYEYGGRKFLWQVSTWPWPGRNTPLVYTYMIPRGEDFCQLILRPGQRSDWVKATELRDRTS